MIYFIFLFISFACAKETKQRKHTDCISSAKNHSRFPKARKLASLKQPALFNGKLS